MDNPTFESWANSHNFIMEDEMPGEAMNDVNTVIVIATKHHLPMTKEVAAEIVKALYEIYEKVIGCQIVLPRHAWDDVCYRNGHFMHLKSRMLMEAFDNGYLPIGMPDMETQFGMARYPGGQIGQSRYAEDSADWDSVQIRLRLKVRRPNA